MGMSPGSTLWIWAQRSSRASSRCCSRARLQNPETSGRLQNQLEVMMRLKNVRNLDNRQSSLVDYAYYQCRSVQPPLPPLDRY